MVGAICLKPMWVCSWSTIQRASNLGSTLGAKRFPGGGRRKIERQSGSSDSGNTWKISPRSTINFAPQAAKQQNNCWDARWTVGAYAIILYLSLLFWATMRNFSYACGVLIFLINQQIGSLIWGVRLLSLHVRLQIPRAPINHPYHSVLKLEGVFDTFLCSSLVLSELSSLDFSVEEENLWGLGCTVLHLEAYPSRLRPTETIPFHLIALVCVPFYYDGAKFGRTRRWWEQKCTVLSFYLQYPKWTFQKIFLGAVQHCVGVYWVVSNVGSIRTISCADSRLGMPGSKLLSHFGRCFS